MKLIYVNCLECTRYEDCKTTIDLTKEVISGIGLECGHFNPVDKIKKLQQENEALKAENKQLQTRQIKGYCKDCDKDSNLRVCLSNNPDGYCSEFEPNTNNNSDMSEE
jgi:hypothetical protein